MEQYINKSDIVAEIESLRCTTFTNFDEGVNATVQTLLEMLDTLEVKEVVDLEEEIRKYIKDNICGYCVPGTEETAKYFFELGLKAQKL